MIIREKSMSAQSVEEKSAAESVPANVPEDPRLHTVAEFPRLHGGDVLACGFGITAAVWTAAYICRLPFLLLPAQVTIGAMLLAVLVGGFVAARYSAKGFWCALWSGALSGFLDLLIVGSLMEDYVRKQHDAAGAIPASVYWVGGSIALNAALASIGGLVGHFVPSRRRRGEGG